MLLPVFHGKRTYPCYTDSIIAKHVMYRSEWFDWDMLHFLEAFLQPGDHFLDIGANTGLHTLLASTRIDPAKGGSITCLEPDPNNVKRLQRTLQLNRLADCTTVHQIAASDTTGVAELTDRDAFARLDAGEGVPEGSSRNRVSATVRTVTLDELLHDSSMFHACKIDVEGAEGKVLRGATHLIESGRLPVLIVELCGHLGRYGETEDGFLDWLRAHGYHRIGSYHHEDRSIHPGPPFAGDDIVAATQLGVNLMRQRIRG